MRWRLVTRLRFADSQKTPQASCSPLGGHSRTLAQASPRSRRREKSGVRNNQRVNSSLFEAGDRVLAPVDAGGRLAAGTVMARRQYKKRSTVEGYNETHTQLLVNFDQSSLGEKWVMDGACQPLEGAGD
jgi:hypothetical protein